MVNRVTAKNDDDSFLPIRERRSPFRLKFCGFTRASDVDTAIKVGADAIGLNFYPRSSRYLEIEQAHAIIEAIDRRALAVGVFVNTDLREILRIASEVGLDLIQLHGNETPESITTELSDVESDVIHLTLPQYEHEDRLQIRLIKAVTWRENDTDDVANVQAWSAFSSVTDPGIGHGEQEQSRHSQQHDFRFEGFLVDAHDPINFGGTGKPGRWELLYPRPPAFSGHPVILAGGLTVENVARAVAAACPDGVDVASGIESRPGIKDAEKMEQFAAQVRSWNS